MKFFRTLTASRRLIYAASCIALVCSLALLFKLYDAPQTSASDAFISEEATDSALQRAATDALGNRQGAIILMDAQTGRLRAVAGSRVAFGEAFPPGSTIKPFTALAALRTGALDAESHMACRQPYRHDGSEIHCVHPNLQSPLDPSQALAYSCNYYFSKIGEQLNEQKFNSTLASFGLGARAGSGIERETQARLPRGTWHAVNALGDTPEILVTPVQLITAYAALSNGGRLFAPQQAAPHNFTPHQRTHLAIEPAHRALLLKGMRGAVVYGTAARAGLASVSHGILGKTGTSTPADDFRATHGWFVGFATEHDSPNVASPAQVRLAVLVFLKRANGVESAELARPIFEEYARLEARRADALAARDAREAATQHHAPDSPSKFQSRPSSNARVRVRLARENAVATLALDDYIFGVLAAEGSTEDEPEALKALAVAARTYALKNLRRHARDGYDLCTTTHCQRYLAVADRSVRPDFYDTLHRVVAGTSGETLRDPHGRIAEAYFSASCGGATADIGTLWGVSAPSHLRGSRDDFCTAEPRRWTDTISAASLTRALRGDPRSDIGARLDNIRIVKRDASGRAAMIVLEGERRRMLRGWDFKIIVGRALGWNVLKSSRFEARRAGANFIFQGTGFGHGLGLCQTGAHIMARRGASYRRILAQYLPGTTLTHNPTSNQTANANPQNTTPSTGLESDPDKKSSNYLDPPDSSNHLDKFDKLDSSNHLNRLNKLDSPNHFGELDKFDKTPADSYQATFHQATFNPHASDNISGMLHQRFSYQSYTSRSPSLRFHDGSSIVPNSPRGGTIIAPVVAAAPRLTMTSENFRASYPARVSRRDVETALRTLEEVRADVSRRLSAAALKPDSSGRVELFIHETTGDFTGATRRPAWVAAIAHARRIDSQPLDALRRRGVLVSTLRHEYVHTVIESLGHGRTPIWLAEGLAAHVAGEGAMLTRLERRIQIPLEELERRLQQPASASDTRILYAAAYREVSALIRREGESDLWRRVARS